MDREVFPGHPIPSRSRGLAIASAIDHVSVVRKLLDEQACHAAVDHRHGIIYKEYVRCKLSLGLYGTPDGGPGRGF